MLFVVRIMWNIHLCGQKIEFFNAVTHDTFRKHCALLG
jgi:hypothetical protein